MLRQILQHFDFFISCQIVGASLTRVAYTNIIDLYFFILWVRVLKLSLSLFLDLLPIKRNRWGFSFLLFLILFWWILGFIIVCLLIFPIFGDLSEWVSFICLIFFLSNGRIRNFWMYFWVRLLNIHQYLFVVIDVELAISDKFVIFILDVCHFWMSVEVRFLSASGCWAVCFYCFLVCSPSALLDSFFLSYDQHQHMIYNPE